MNTTLNQALIEELAIAILEGTDEDCIRIKTVIDMLPNGEEIHDLVAEKMAEITMKAIRDEISAYIAAPLDEEEEVRELKTNELAESIRKQLETPQVSLEELIGQQLAKKKEQELADLISKQVNKADVLEEIINEIVERLIYDLSTDSEDNEALHLSLHPSSIEYYAEIFEEVFEEILAEKGIDMEYRPEITEKAMNELVNYLQFEMGAEVGFVKAGDILCPVLSIQ